jgi:6-phosphogluconolactonase
VLAQRVAETVCALIRSAIQLRGAGVVALAGGDTPRRIYEILAGEPYKSEIDWQAVHLFFGDERMVPPGDPASNFGMVERKLTSRVPIPMENIHRIRGESEVHDAEMEYEGELRRWFRGRRPRFDIVLLGVGEDGHTASLFPDTDALRESTKNVLGYFVPQLQAWRITLTLPVLLNAREILVVAAGRRKALALERIFHAIAPAPSLPASMITPANGGLHWFLDVDAASLMIDVSV